jgi:hypothetical protein
MNKPRGKTGPTTNAVNHNSTSTSLIVKGEDAAAFTTLLESLTAEYQPETQGQQITVNEAARAVWELARANREFDKSQHALYDEEENMRDWNPGQQTEFERMLRYRTRAERTHGRALKAVEYLRKLHLQAQQRAFWENLQLEHLELAKERLKHSEARTRQAAELNANAKANLKKKEPPPPINRNSSVSLLSQVIVVSLKDSTPHLEIYPSNADMLYRAEIMEPATQVLRRFEFPNGIPAEYAWVNGPGVRRSGIIWEQHFWTLEAWRAHLATEAPGGPEHFLPCIKL